MEIVYQWALNLSYYLIITTLFLHLLPGKEYEKYVRFFVNLILVMMLLSPIVNWEQTEDEIEKIEERIEERLDQYEAWQQYMATDSD